MESGRKQWSWPGNKAGKGLGSVLLCVLGKFDPVNQEPHHPVRFPKYLRCYRCLLETKELGCLLGSDICLASSGSSCMTLLIKNSKAPSPVHLGPSPFPNWVSLYQFPKLHSKSGFHNSKILFHCRLFPSEPLHFPYLVHSWLAFTLLTAPNLVGTLKITRPIGLSSGWLLPMSAVVAASISLLLPVPLPLPSLLQWVLPHSPWPLVVRVHQNLGLNYLSVSLPDVYLLSWLQLAATYCFLLNLSVLSHCHVKWPSGHLHLTFNLPKIDYISLFFMPALPPSSLPFES